MRVLFHSEFAHDVNRFAGQYRRISETLGKRFQNETLEAVERIKTSPTMAGHFLNTGSTIATDIRRRTLPSFPFFVLYGLHQDMLVFGALIPSASDPLTWLPRFSPGSTN